MLKLDKIKVISRETKARDTGVNQPDELKAMLL